MNQRLQVAILFILDRLGEASTWQGVGFILSASGAKWAANLDWGSAAFVGAMVSAFIKTVFPDKLGIGELVKAKLGVGK